MPSTEGVVKIRQNKQISNGGRRDMYYKLNEEVLVREYK